MKKLLPCWSCGRKEIEIIKCDYRRARFVMCSYCGVRTADYGKQEDAINRWNTRYNIINKNLAMEI